MLICCVFFLSIEEEIQGLFKPHVHPDRLQKESSDHLLHFLWSMGIDGLDSDVLLRSVEGTARPRTDRMMETGFI